MQIALFPFFKGKGSAIKKRKLLFAATWKDLEIIILSEVSQKEKGIRHVTSGICRI